MSTNPTNTATVTTTPTVTTNQIDYAPSTTATITATNFGIGDDLQFSITIIDPTTGAVEYQGPIWDAIEGTGANGLGYAQTSFYVSQIYANTTIELSVTDLTNPSESATIVFT